MGISYNAMTALSICLVSCQPPEREYPRGDIAEYFVPPMIVAQHENADLPSKFGCAANHPCETEHSPGIKPCACEPLSCNGTPIVSGGTDGCLPTLGGDNIGAVDIRTAQDEPFTIWQGGAPSLTLESDAPKNWFLASFSGFVSATRFIEAPPVFVTGYHELADNENTLLVEPNGDTATIKLPVAYRNIGRIVRIKKGQSTGTIDIQPSVNGWTNLLDHIEWSPGSYSMTPNQFSPHASIVLQAYYADPQLPLNVPHKTGWAIIAIHP